MCVVTWQDGGLLATRERLIKVFDAAVGRKDYVAAQRLLAILESISNARSDKDCFLWPAQ